MTVFHPWIEEKGLKVGGSGNEFFGEHEVFIHCGQIEIIEKQAALT